MSHPGGDTFSFGGSGGEVGIGSGLAVVPVARIEPIARLTSERLRLVRAVLNSPIARRAGPPGNRRSALCPSCHRSRTPGTSDRFPGLPPLANRPVSRPSGLMLLHIQIFN
jgi:hypothetical protein